MDPQFISFADLRGPLGPKTAGVYVTNSQTCSRHPSSSSLLRAVGRVTDPGYGRLQVQEGRLIVSYRNWSIQDLTIRFNETSAAVASPLGLKIGDRIAVFAAQEKCDCAYGQLAVSFVTNGIVSPATKAIPSDDRFPKDQLANMFLVRAMRTMPVRNLASVRFEHNLAILHQGQEIHTRLQGRDDEGNGWFDNGLRLTRADLMTTAVFVIP